MTADEKMQEILRETLAQVSKDTSYEERPLFSEVFNQALSNMFADIMQDITVGGVSAAFDQSYSFLNRIRDDVATLLAEKRDFGAKKYGERSFQNSFDNLMQCPVGDHLKEELIDALNYALTLQYIGILRWDEEEREFYRDIVGDLIEIYGRIQRREEKQLVCDE